MKVCRGFLQLLLGCLCLAAAAGVAAQSSYPAKPVRMINPFAAGGTSDQLTRILAAGLSKNFGQNFIVENRVGGDGIIGTAAVAKAAPDGYNILLTSEALLIAHWLYPDLPYDTKDLAPVVGLARTESALVVHPSVPANDVKGFIAYAKANPGKLNMGAASPLTFLKNALFMENTGTNLSMVNYKGAAQATVDLVAGNIQVAIFSTQLVEPPIKGGKLKGLAISGDKRYGGFPDVPTFAEAGVKFDPAGPLQFTLYIPARTPADIMEKISTQSQRVLAQPEVAQALVNIGLTPKPTPLAEVTRIFPTELAHFGALIKASGLKLQGN